MPPTGTPGLTPPLDRTRYDCLAPGSDGHLLVNHLDDLLLPTPPPLDGQHSIGKGAAHQLSIQRDYVALLGIAFPVDWTSGTLFGASRVI